MKTKTESIKKISLLVGCLLFSAFQSVSADSVQESLNLDYFRTPEASAFKKYGEESVNEYTGTADISVPLYTIKCRDVEIPIELRYDASGIKVEQEASWVGLGWNLMVGGCINYVCAGAKDLEIGPYIPDKTWTEYLTRINSYQFYNYKKNDTISNWMNTVPYYLSFIEPYSEKLTDGWGVKQYLERGYGERDFYSVNILGRSFMFFVDPFTLKTYKIGQAGDEFKIEIEPTLEKKGEGRQERIQNWIITDPNGFVYKFSEGDRLEEPTTGWWYTSCWYLTEINSPKGEIVKFTYTHVPKHYSRAMRVENLFCPILEAHDIHFSESDFIKDRYTSYLTRAYVNNYYLEKIITGNQTVIFQTTDCKESSGKRLDRIKILSNGTLFKTFNFSYDHYGFEYSDIGGNYAPADGQYNSEKRLKLDNVKEIASSDTLTTSFSYNSLKLPSKRSCAQDYWGYYNGKNNYVEGRGYSMIPTPKPFMSFNYTTELSGYAGADRFSDSIYMQAAILNKVVYPTKGYSTYEYEPNTIRTEDFTLTEKYRKKKYDVSVMARFSCSTSPYGLVVDQSNQIKEFTLSQETTFELLLRCSGQNQLHGQAMRIELHNPNGTLTTIPATFLPHSNETYIQSLTLPAGKYTLVVIPINNSQSLPFSIRWSLNGWYKENISKKNYPLACGGLRIKKISNYDNNNSLINFITYNYNNENGSTGVLLNNIETIDSLHYRCFKDELYDPTATYMLNYMADADVYSITPGRTRFAEFYASCNPGIVGYSQVTKCRYSPTGRLENSVITTFKNEGPKNYKDAGMSKSVFDYYRDFSNGEIINQKTLDANDNVVLNVDNTYSSHLDNHYAVNMGYHNEIILGNSVVATYSGANIPHTIIWRYPYILSRVNLSKTTSTEYCPNGNAIIRTKSYTYNGNNHQISQIDENTSLSNQTRRTKITYTADGTDNISRSMKAVHRLNDVVENKNILVVNGQEKRQSTQHTTYTFNGSYYMPGSFSMSIGDASLEPRSVYLYDDSLNIKSISVDGIETVYIWSYYGQYPIAKIEGLAYGVVLNTIGSSTISTFLAKAVPTEEDLSSLRDKIKKAGGHITTFTHKPLVGVTSETLPNEQTIRYEYDGLGRLVRVVDHNGSVISKNSYNYKK